MQRLREEGLTPSPPTRLRRRAASALLAGCAVAALGTLTAGLPTRAQAQGAMPEAERQRVERLLRAVEAQAELRFERNGRRAGPADAVRFLRAKWAQRGAAVRSAEAFIEQVASRSSTSGLPYRVCPPGAPCVEAGPWLRALLAHTDGRAGSADSGAPPAGPASLPR